MSRPCRPIDFERPPDWPSFHRPFAHSPETRLPGKSCRPGRTRGGVILVLVVGLAVMAGRWLAPQTVGEQARRVFQQQLQDHYSDWTVEVGRGTYRSDVGLIFESIHLRPRTQRASSTAAAIGDWWSPRNTIQIDRLTVFADVHPERLLDGENPLDTRRIVVEGLRGRAEMDADGRSTLATLWPPPQFGPVCPQVDLVDATVELSFAQPNPDAIATHQPVMLHWSHLSVTATCDASPGQPGRTVTTERYIRGAGRSSISGPLTLDLHQTTRTDSAGIQTSTFPRVQMSAQAVQIDQSLLDAARPCLGDRVAEWFVRESIASVQWSLRGDLDLRYAAVDDSGQPDAFQVDIQIDDGMWHDPRLPSRLQSVRGRIVATPAAIKLYPSQAMFGDALCHAEGEMRLRRQQRQKQNVAPGMIGQPEGDESLWSRLSLAPGPCRWDVSAEGLTIDRSFATVMPARATLLWDRLDPQGRLDIRGVLTNDQPLSGGRWDIQADVRCLGVDVRLDRFPYPVRDVVGSVRIANGKAIATGLTGRAGDQRLLCEFEVPLPTSDRQPEITPPKTILLRTDGAIAIDDTLIKSLTPRQSLTGSPPRETSKLERFVRSLNPRGAIELASASIVTDASGRTRRQFDLRVTGGTMRYDEFAYPLYNVAGRIQVQDDLTRIIGFTANNAGAAQIACDGLYQMATPDSVTGRGDDSELNLRFRVSDVAMEHSLRTSLPPATRGVWDALAPAGTLDRLDVHVHQAAAGPVELVLEAAELDSGAIGPETLSIRPRALPYRIDVIAGQVRYANDEVTIENLRGRHDLSQLVADGRCVRISPDRWKLSMELHSGCRLNPDDELISALPATVASAMKQLQLRGPVRLRGQSNLTFSETQDDAPEIDWNLLCQLEGNRLGDVGPVHSMRGEIAVRGISDAEAVRASGTVAIDSIHAYGLQLTSIRGPFAVEGDRMALGTASGKTPIVGQLFGGQLDLSGGVLLSTGDFDLGVRLVGGEVNTLLSELGQARTDMTGRFDVTTNLDGRIGDTDLLKGNGTARLSGANLYQLPLLVQVFNLLRIRATEDVAFTDGEADFALFGEDINFDRLVLWGDLVALDGGGTLTRQDMLDLSFNTRVSPQNLFSKVISPLRDERYTFWTIRVEGPIANPTIQRRALNGFSQTMEAWFPGTIRSTNTAEGADATIQR